MVSVLEKSKALESYLDKVQRSLGLVEIINRMSTQLGWSNDPVKSLWERNIDWKWSPPDRAVQEGREWTTPCTLYKTEML